MAVVTMNGSYGLPDVIERVLDKGLAINADISISIVGTEILSIRINAALASFETAARYGLEFPGVVNRTLPAWKESLGRKEKCPGCGRREPAEKLLETGCPWCAWAPVKKSRRKALKLKDG